MLVRGPRTAGQHRDGMALVLKSGDERGPEKTCTTRNNDLHPLQGTSDEPVMQAPKRDAHELVG